MTDPKSLAKAVLVCESFGFKEREAQGWLEILGPYLKIHEKLDDKTIGDAYDKIEVIHILKQIFEKTKSSNGINSGDGTKLEISRKQNYEQDKKYGEWLTSIVDSREIVQAFSIFEHELKAMHHLIYESEGNSLRLDAGFVDRLLVKNVAKELKKIGFTPVEIYDYKSIDERAKQGFTTINRIELNGTENLKKWLLLLGFSSPKHKEKIRKYFGENSGWKI